VQPRLSAATPSARGTPEPDALHNRLLASLPASDRIRLVESLTIVPLTLKTVLHEPGRPITAIYFPGDGFCSILTVTEDGRMVEVATVGREGMAGLGAIANAGPSNSMTMVQGASEVCYRLSADTFRAELDRSAAFNTLVKRYVDAHIAVVMQSTACNAIHSVEQRLARWLLMAHDRVGTDKFPLTQEFVAMMLGANRSTVTVIAGTLQRAGLITYHRGQVAILDRERLESASCECYRVATKLLAAVIDPAVRR